MEITMNNLKAHGTKKRIVDKRTILLIMLIAAIVVFLTGNMIVKASDRNTSDASVKRYYDCIMINKNDTLWSIAEQYAPTGVSTSDYVREIKKLNKLKNDDINQGQYLMIYDYQLQDDVTRNEL
jgi:LysM repeat protein